MPKLDSNNDNVISKEELEQGRELLELNLREKKAKAQQKMAWIAVISMLIYATLPLMPFIPAEKLVFIEAMSDMLFISQASIVGFFFGATAYMSKNNNNF